MPEKEKWKREFSAGGIVYKKEKDKVFILLIQPFGRNWGPPEGHWTFPKGWKNEGEDVETAALREVREEGGVTAQIKSKLDSVKFFRNFDKTLKFIDYYLMEYVSGDPKDHDLEVADAGWFEISEANTKLKFPQDKDILSKALNQVDQH